MFVMVKHKPLLGVNISLVNNKTVISEIEKLLKEKSQVFITTPNPEHLMQAQNFGDFKDVLNSASLAVPDGVGLVWALKQRYPEIAQELERVTGVDLMLKICNLAAQKEMNVGLLGGRNGVAKKAAEALKRTIPEIKVFEIGLHKDIKTVNNEENDAIIKRIQEKKINILFVAYGAPHQELWIAQNLKSLPQVKIAMGVGGAFDFLAGRVKRAPLWVQKLGLEWFFRLVQEPWRWKRQLCLISFAWKVMRKEESKVH
jgi:N-acetylglucosaminyldiphosphoundecaprenol N-acetyl-beta-D-mannosaminyltransferase